MFLATERFVLSINNIEEAIILICSDFLTGIIKFFKSLFEWSWLVTVNKEEQRLTVAQLYSEKDICFGTLESQTASCSRIVGNNSRTFID